MTKWKEDWFSRSSEREDPISSFDCRFILWSKSGFFLFLLSCQIISHWSSVRRLFFFFFFFFFLSYIESNDVVLIRDWFTLGMLLLLSQNNKENFPDRYSFLLTMFSSSAIHFDNVTTMKDLFSLSLFPHFFSQCYNEIVSCLFFDNSHMKNKAHTSISIYIYHKIWTY